MEIYMENAQGVVLKEAAAHLIGPDLSNCEVNLISLIALKVLPDILSLCRMSLVCKKFNLLEVKNLQRLDFISRYFPLPDILSKYQAIQLNELKLHTQGKFIFQWFGPRPHLCIAKIEPIFDGVPFDIKTLLEKEDYVTAFAIAAWLDGETYIINYRRVQEALIKKFGYKMTLQLTLALTGERIRDLALLAYIETGCAAMKLPRLTSFKKLQKVRKHEFIVALQEVDGAAEIPVYVVDRLISNIIHRAIGNICYNPEMSTDDELSEENDESAPRKEIVKEWLSFIPKDSFLFGLKDTTDLPWEHMCTTFSVLLEVKGITDEYYNDFLQRNNLR